MCLIMEQNVIKIYDLKIQSNIAEFYTENSIYHFEFSLYNQLFLYCSGNIVYGNSLDTVNI